MSKVAPIKKILDLLERYYPDAHCALDHKNPFELLVATVLSAQCTDDRVNLVTPALFKKFPTPEKMAKAKIEDLENLVRSTGFYKNKAANLKNCAISLVQNHQGQIPQNMDALTALAGVGRKTANVLLGNAFGISSGVVVDTHVMRLTNRFGWVQSRDAVAIERILNKKVPQKHWIQFSHWLITHGRQICKARKPACDKCFLFEHCPKRPYGD